MDSRSLFERCFRAVFACWFALVLSQPVVIRACPLMGGVLEEVAPGAVAQVMDHAHMQHMQAADVAPSEQAPMHDHEKSQCTCLSDCCGSLPAVLPVLGRHVPVPARVVASTPQFPVIEQSFEQPDYLQPPSTAPPAVSLVILSA